MKKILTAILIVMLIALESAAASLRLKVLVIMYTSLFSVSSVLINMLVNITPIIINTAATNAEKRLNPFEPLKAIIL